MQQQSEALMRYDFQGVPVGVVHHDGQLWVTGDDIGRALEYSDPARAIHKLFMRNREELEQYSCVVKVGVGNTKKAGLRGPSDPAGGGETAESAPEIPQRRAVRVFNRHGGMILTMLSSQPKAVPFRGWLVKIADAAEHGDLAFSSNNRETLLVTCIKEARFGNPFAIHTLVERFGYPQAIKREIKADLYRRAFRDKAESPEIVDWFIDDYLQELRAEIEGEPGHRLQAIRNRPPSTNWTWKEIDDPGARWALRHRPSDLYGFIVPIAEGEEIEIDLTSNRFTRWLTYGAARLKARGWERVEHKRSKGQETFLLRMLDIAE